MRWKRLREEGECGIPIPMNWMTLNGNRKKNIGINLGFFENI